jgi:hypothetical protein
MKTILHLIPAMLLLSAITFGSCTKIGIVEHPVPPIDSGAISTMTQIRADTIIFAPSDSSALERVTSVKLILNTDSGICELASANYVNGGFTLLLPDVVESKYLNAIGKYVPYCQSCSFSGASIVATTWNAVCARIDGVTAYDSAGSVVGKFFYSFYDNDAITTTNFTYVDREIFFYGYTEDATSMHYFDKVLLQRRWNIWYTKSTNSGRNLWHTSECDSAVNMQWYFTAD